jgi:hypothetical protein
MIYVDGSLDYVLYLVGKIGVNLLKYKNISQITGLYEITCLSSFDSNVLTNRAATEHIGFWWIKYTKKMPHRSFLHSHLSIYLSY